MYMMFVFEVHMLSRIYSFPLFLFLPEYWLYSEVIVTASDAWSFGRQSCHSCSLLRYWISFRLVLNPLQAITEYIKSITHAIPCLSKRVVWRLANFVLVVLSTIHYSTPNTISSYLIIEIYFLSFVLSSDTFHFSYIAFLQFTSLSLFLLRVYFISIES